MQQAWPGLLHVMRRLPARRATARPTHHQP